MATDRASRTKALLSGAITVAVLAVILIVLGLFGPLRFGKQPAKPAGSTALTGQTTSQTLYQQALQAQASGDLTRTAQLAQAAVTADPTNTQAKALLDSVSKTAPAGSTAASTTPSSLGTTAPAGNPDAAFLAAFTDLTKLMPKSASGFSLDVPVQFKSDATLSGTSVSGTKGITQVSWTVHDMKSVAAAKSFMTKTSKKLFPKNAATVTVHGVNGYFGTDGTRFATVEFSRGRYAFEVLITVKGVSPATAKSVAIAAAGAFPTTPSQ